MDEHQQIVSPIVKILLHKLQSLRKQNVTLGRDGVNNVELERLETILSSFRAVLLDAEKQQLHNNDVRGWLKKLKDACYDAEDALNELEMEQSRSITGKVCDFISCSKSPANLRFTTDNEKIKEIKERLDAIKVDVSKFSFQDRVHHDNGNVPREWEIIAHLSFVVTSDVFGRYADKENIIDLLIPDELHRKIHIWKKIRNVSVDGNIIHISGPSGIGKTTLAKMVYKDNKIDEYFDIKMWEDRENKAQRDMIVLESKPVNVKYRHLTRKEVDIDMQKVIFEHLKCKSKKIIDKFDNYIDNHQKTKKLLERRGDYVITKKFSGESNWSTVEVDFDHSLLAWHIATTLCYYYDHIPEFHLKPEISKHLSDYMLYLLVFCPSMLSKGISFENKYKDTCNAIKSNIVKSNGISDEESQMTSLKSNEISDDESQMTLACKGLLEDVKSDQEEDDMSVLHVGHRLAQRLQSSEVVDKWEMLSEVWIEMFSYAANRCAWKEHGRQLTNGGELLTHVSLLMAHLGLSEQYEMKKNSILALSDREWQHLL
ncbi:hypothetical protein Dsin_014295 [Dipteronia sinensis]|uniref:Uncharacterized protein n=1 Tax=Dipteronia sinensis TaxID=43782 RepID=A0AAE0AMB3_9ROSI|nr:hypothetical protein Dsin_014295 [Dipteronia sinensis]